MPGGVCDATCNLSSREPGTNDPICPPTLSHSALGTPARPAGACGEPCRGYCSCPGTAPPGKRLLVLHCPVLKCSRWLLESYCEKQSAEENTELILLKAKLISSALAKKKKKGVAEREIGAFHPTPPRPSPLALLCLSHTCQTVWRKAGDASAARPACQPRRQG